MRLSQFVIIALVAPLAIAPGGQAEETCIQQGGETDESALGVFLPLDDESAGAYLSTADGTVWIEENGVRGLQRTARTCEGGYEADLSLGSLLS